MNRKVLAAAFTLLLAAAPAMAQMMGSNTPGQHMTPQQQAVPQQQQMHPGMMGGGYGYGMNPQMMGGYGYGMHPQMMGGYGYGYGMHPQMMGGYGMHPGIMGYGMHQGMMGGCGINQPYGGMQQPYYQHNREYGKFLDDTRDTRRKMHSLMFEYGEAARSPEPDKEKLEKMEKEMNELRSEMFNYKTK